MPKPVRACRRDVANAGEERDVDGGTFVAVQSHAVQIDGRSEDAARGSRICERDADARPACDAGQTREVAERGADRGPVVAGVQHRGYARGAQDGGSRAKRPERLETGGCIVGKAQKAARVVDRFEGLDAGEVYHLIPDPLGRVIGGRVIPLT